MRERLMTHSDVTAMRLPLGSTAMLRIATPAALVTSPSISLLASAYFLTSESWLPENQASF